MVPKMNLWSNFKSNFKIFLVGLYTLGVISGCAAGVSDLEKKVQEPPKKEDYGAFSRGLNKLKKIQYPKADELGLFYNVLQLDVNAFEKDSIIKEFRKLDPSSDDSIKVKEFMEKYLEDKDPRKETPENEYWEEIKKRDEWVKQYFQNSASQGSKLWEYVLKFGCPQGPPIYNEVDCTEALEARLRSNFRDPNFKKCEVVDLSYLTFTVRFEDAGGEWKKTYATEEINTSKTSYGALDQINSLKAEIKKDNGKMPEINIFNEYTGEIKYSKDWAVDVVLIPDSNSALGQLEKQLLSSNQNGNFHNTNPAKWTLWNTAVFDPSTVKSEVLKERSGGVLEHKYVIYNVLDSVVARNSTIIPITIDSLVHPDSINIFNFPWVFYFSVALKEGKYNIAESFEFSNTGAKKIGCANFSVNIPPQTGSISDILIPSLFPFKKQKGRGIVTDNPDSNQICLIDHFPFTNYIENGTFDFCFYVADLPPNSGIVEVRYSLTPIEKRKKKIGEKPEITQGRPVVNPSDFKNPPAEMESLYAEYLRDIQRETLKPENVLIGVDTLKVSNSRLFVSKRLILPIIPQNVRSSSNNYDFTVQVMPSVKYAMPYISSRILNIKEKPKNNLSKGNSQP